MKVLVLSPELPYPPTHGGGRLKLFQLLKHLAPLHELTLLTLLDTPQEREHLPALENFCSRIVAIERKPSALTWRERLQAPFYRLAWSEEAARAIHDELCNGDYDLVHVDQAHMAVYTPLLREHRKIMAAHDCETLQYQSRVTTAKGLKQKLRARVMAKRVSAFESEMYRQYNGCIVVGQPDAEMLRYLCPGLPVSLVPSGVDAEFFTPNPAAERDDELIFTGTMDFLPNEDAALHFVADLLPKIRAKIPATRFSVVGRAPTERVQALARNDGVTVTGFVDDMRTRVQPATVFVCPMRLGAGMKNKMLEAMAMGKAIVATRSAASGLEVSDARELLIRDDDDEFANAVITLMQNAPMRRKFGEAARCYVEEGHSWERTGQLMNEAYAECAGNRASVPQLNK